MKGDAIFRVTTALQSRLKLALPAAGFNNGTVFVGPLDDRDSREAQLILFLYRIVPNASLRNREHRIPSVHSPHIDVFENSIPLDLYFLVTVGTMPGSGEEPLLRALGSAMQTLQANPELSGAHLNHEVVRVTLEPLTTEEISRIWALFPAANYRTSVAYIASPVWIDPSIPVQSAAPVVDDRLFAGSKRTEVQT